MVIGSRLLDTVPDFRSRCPVMTGSAGNRPYRALSSKRFLFLSKGCFSLSLLVYLLWKTDPRQVFRTLYTIEPVLFIAAGLLYLGCQYLSSYRWQILMRGQDMFQPLNRLFSFYLVGMFFNNFLPTSAGGDVIKGYALYRASGKGKEAVSTIFLERYTGLVAVIVIGIGVLAVGYADFPDPKVALFLTGMGAGLAGGTWAAVHPRSKVFCFTMIRKWRLEKVERVFSGLYEAFGRYRTARRPLVHAFLLSLGIQFLNILVYIVLAEAMDLAVPWGYFFLFFPVVTLMAMFPISLNGLGVREGVFVYLFSRIDVPSAQALGFSLSWFFMTVAISLIGGLIFVFRGGFGRLETEQ